jgi:hypothetical protein
MKPIDLYLDLDGVILRRTGRTEFAGALSLKLPRAGWIFSRGLSKTSIVIG